MESTAIATHPSKSRVWAGRIIRALVILFLLFDLFGKFTKPEPVLKGTLALGYPESLITTMGVLLLICAVLYVIPRTAILGAIFLTGYLGGAVASNLRIGAPLFSDTLFPVYFAILAWAGIYFRDARIIDFILGENKKQ